MQSSPQNATTGFVRYASIHEVLADSRLFAYHHLISVAWSELELDSIVCINNLPTVYIHRSRTPIESNHAAKLHQLFWNQGIATLLILRDPKQLHVYSAQALPTNSDKTVEFSKQSARVETVMKLASFALWFEKLQVSLETGAYYQTHAEKFKKENAVDDYLLLNLSHTRDALTSGRHKLTKPEAHAFLGRILFCCYLIDRGIVALPDYIQFDGNRLLDWLGTQNPEAAIQVLYGTLFPELRKRLNGSMFDDALEAERKRIHPSHIRLLTHFLSGTEMITGQQTLGFWAYEFQMIPVETISGIYEDFLKAEDEKGKHKAGAFYTPRLLAEMTLDVLLENETESIANKRFLDPSCGSGIFLVLLFNRLAAEWTFKHPEAAKDYKAKAEALRGIFQNNIRGIDINPTACRIACFSLYLAYLDQFDPRSIIHHAKTVGKFLPNIIVAKKKAQPAGQRKLIPVITEADFLKSEDSLGNEFDFIIGNPPWAQRGNSLEQQFMLAAPTRLKTNAQAGLLLPSKVFFNGKTNNFQKRWLAKAEIEKVVLLADYRRILFAEAKCPCMIVRFHPLGDDAATENEDWIEYVTPKAYGLEVRNGSIPVSPDDQKWIRPAQLKHAIRNGEAPQFWKSYFWGSARDQKFLDLLCDLPKLEAHTGTASQVEKGEKRWAKGQGFQPLYQHQLDRGDTYQENTWSGEDLFIKPSQIGSSSFLPAQALSTLDERLESLNAISDKLRRKPEDHLFTPPLILFNQGFSKFAFFDYPVRFQDSLQSIAGKSGDEGALLFLAAYLKSKLAYYYLFHTSSNIGMERTKAHLDEVLRLPFFFPEDDSAPANAKKLIKSVASKMRSLQRTLNKNWEAMFPASKSDELELQADTDKGLRKQWEQFAEQATNQLVEQTINPLIFEYFGLIDQEIALVEDTCEILQKSITPDSLDNCDGIRQPINEAALHDYAQTLVQTLSGWMLEDSKIHINAVCRIHEELGLAGVELIQSKKPTAIRVEVMSDEEALAYTQLESVAIEERGSLHYLRTVRLFDGKHIRVYKPAKLGFWMRSTAINDAAALYAEIIQA